VGQDIKIRVILVRSYTTHRVYLHAFMIGTLIWEQTSLKECFQKKDVIYCRGAFCTE